LDLGEVLGESGDALREGLKGRLRSLGGMRVGRGEVRGEEVDCAEISKEGDQPICHDEEGKLNA
jgi:hypothetical protein